MIYDTLYTSAFPLRLQFIHINLNTDKLASKYVTYSDLKGFRGIQQSVYYFFTLLNPVVVHAAPLADCNYLISGGRRPPRCCLLQQQDLTCIMPFLTSITTPLPPPAQNHCSETQTCFNSSCISALSNSYREADALSKPSFSACLHCKQAEPCVCVCVGRGGFNDIC